MQLTENEKAYIAGIVDGEGCISIIRANAPGVGMKSPLYRLRISIYNTNQPLMKWLSDKLGETVYERKKTGNHKRSFVITISSTKNIEFLKDIQPFLIIKSKQASLALGFQILIDNYKSKLEGTFPGAVMNQEELNNRESTCQGMRLLNAGQVYWRNDVIKLGLRRQTDAIEK